MQYTQLPRRGIILFSILLALVSGSCDVVSNLSDLSANAGSDQTVLLGETVQLDGSGSIDLLGGSSFTYAWSFTSTPSGSAVTISSADQSGATFTPDEVGTYLVQLTISNGDESDTDEVTITVEEDPNNPTDPPFPLEGSITESRTLAKVADSGPDYVINSFLSIEADVTIEPGVIIQLGERAGILITDVGSLTAEGTADNVITFTGATQSAGYWGAISFGSNTSANRLSHVVIEYGGADGISFITEDASVILLGNARLSLEDVIVRNSGSYGLNLSNSAASVTLSGTNTFTLNDTPILSTMQQLGSLSSADSYSGNTHDFVEVINDGAVDSDATWPALDVPYMMPGNVAVLDADVVLSAGSEFVFAADGGVSITQNGSLNAVGTSTNAIIFRGENDERGFWRGLEYNSNNTDNRLEWVEVKNGGSRGFDGADLRTNIIIQGSARLEMVSVTTSKCSGYGLYLRDADVRVPTFSLNVAFENEAPIYCWPQHYGYFDTDSDLVGNDDDYIDTQAASASVTAAATWRVLSVPYRLPNNVTNITGDITIEAGAEFWGQPLSGISVDNGGSLNATGTATTGITFRGEQDVVGYWRGLQYRSNNANNVLDYVTLANGGTRGFDGGDRRANLEILPTAMATITNSTVRDSGGFGIRILEEGNLTQSNNTFSGNTSTGNTANGGIEDDNI